MSQPNNPLGLTAGDRISLNDEGTVVTGTVCHTYPDGTPGARFYDGGPVVPVFTRDLCRTSGKRMTEPVVREHPVTGVREVVDLWEME